MKRVVRIQRQGKVKDVGPIALATVPAAEDVDIRVALIQDLIPLGLQAAAKALVAEVTAQAGVRCMSRKRFLPPFFASLILWELCSPPVC